MDAINKINKFAGVDWSLDKIFVSDEIAVCLLNEKGHRITISCHNFIGFSFVGYWAERTIEHIKVEPEGDLINDSLMKIKSIYGEHPLPAGENKKIDGIWNQLDLKLIDGNVIKVACEDFTFDIGVHK